LASQPGPRRASLRAHGTAGLASAFRLDRSDPACGHLHTRQHRGRL